MDTNVLLGMVFAALALAIGLAFARRQPKRSGDGGSAWGDGGSAGDACDAGSDGGGCDGGDGGGEVGGVDRGAAEVNDGASPVGGAADGAAGRAEGFGEGDGGEVGEVGEAEFGGETGAGGAVHAGAVGFVEEKSHRCDLGSARMIARQPAASATFPFGESCTGASSPAEFPPGFQNMSMPCSYMA